MTSAKILESKHYMNKTRLIKKKANQPQSRMRRRQKASTDLFSLASGIINCTQPDSLSAASQTSRT
jgi:hypothetical protein